MTNVDQNIRSAQRLCQRDPENQKYWGHLKALFERAKHWAHLKPYLGIWGMSPNNDPETLSYAFTDEWYLAFYISNQCQTRFHFYSNYSDNHDDFRRQCRGQFELTSSQQLKVTIEYDYKYSWVDYFHEKSETINEELSTAILDIQKDSDGLFLLFDDKKVRWHSKDSQNLFQKNHETELDGKPLEVYEIYGC